MFAIAFDDLRRRVAKKNVELRPLATCSMGTDEWELYWKLYNAENSVIDVKVEDDNRTYTFYTIHKHHAVNA